MWNDAGFPEAGISRVPLRFQFSDALLCFLASAFSFLKHTGQLVDLTLSCSNMPLCCSRLEVCRHHCVIQESSCAVLQCVVCLIVWRKLCDSERGSASNQTQGGLWVWADDESDENNLFRAPTVADIIMHLGTRVPDPRTTLFHAAVIRRCGSCTDYLGVFPRVRKS
eukprot:985002-Rhodomonas_salina.2